MCLFTRIGRDTPSSQITENEIEETGAIEEVVPPPPPSKTKQPRFDLDDKFGKFEIKNLPHCKFCTFQTFITGYIVYCAIV